MDPIFIVVEGIDGSGTTSCSKLLVQKMVEQKIDCLWTKEPSDGTIGRHIRKILTEQEAADELGMFPLFLADRHDHIASIVRPNLEQGQTVVCDRYAYSTWVYQQDSYDPFFIEYAQRSCLAPDFVFVLNCPVEVCMGRIGERDVVERYEVVEKQKLYSERYRRIPKIREEIICNLDSYNDSPEELVDQIRSVIGF